jgi:hypothetical protein
MAKKLAAVAIVIAVIVIGWGNEERASAATSIVPDHTGAQLAEPAEVGRWTVDVSLSRSRFGPLRFSTGAARRAPSSSSHPWIQHRVKITNLNDEREVQLGDTRTSKYLDGPPDRALLGADEGCGYGYSEGQEGIDVGVCALYLDIPTLNPGESIRRTVTLFKGLDGMQPLEPGAYEFHKKVKFSVGHRPERTRPLTITYDIERTPTP